MGHLWHSYFSSCAYTFKISHYAPGIKYLIAYKINAQWREEEKNKLSENLV